MKSKTKINSANKSIKEATSKINKIAEQLKKGAANQILIGLPEGSNNYPDGTSVIMVGTVHEFGSDGMGIPQRSFLRTTMNSNKKKYKLMVEKFIKKLTSGNITFKKINNLMGVQVQTDVRSKITDIKNPKLKNREGNPLVDTGHLRQSIIYEIRNAD